MPIAGFFFLAHFFLGTINLAAQPSQSTSTPPPEPVKVTLSPSERVSITSTGSQEMEGIMQHARGNVVVTTQTMRLTADEVDRNTETGDIEARGNVHFENLQDGQKMSCELAQYNINTDIGKFKNVAGSAPANVEYKPGLLRTQNPYYFEGEWLDKTKDRYVLHNGFITDCKPDDMWWKLKAKSFDIIPGDRAIAKNSTMVLKDVPIFYFPAFYKSLEEKPRKSGFLTPNIGNSSQRGQVIGGGYFWAINRSYDLMYRTQYYTRRGFVHQADFAGWINQKTTFDFGIFGAGANQALNLRGGYVMTMDAKSEIGKGWEARGELRQLSALRFRQEFTQSFAEAINSETHSVGFITKHWGDYGINFVAQRNVNYQTDIPNDEIVVRKLPEAQFNVREHSLRNLPIYFSMESSFGLERRNQPSFQTRQFVQRADISPRISTAAHWFGLDLAPSFSLRNTTYDSKIRDGKLSGENLIRSARDFQFDLGLPRLSRIFAAPKWMRAGDQVKHVVEARATYRNVSGVNDFRQTIRFDETDIMTNTHEVEFSLTNRLLRRNGSGGVEDVVSWQVWYKRYLDPTFGGAILLDKRNVIDATANLTGYAFLTGQRNQSPIVSILRVQSRVGTEWRTDYDPVRHAFVNSTLSVDARFGQFFALVSHSQLNTNPVLAPKANQLRGQFQWGNDNRRGFNYGFSTGYDYIIGQLQYMQGQTTYNTDCCGFSLQYRRFNFNVINDNQFRVAFSIANIGSFGTLRKQERIF